MCAVHLEVKHSSQNSMISNNYIHSITDVIISKNAMYKSDAANILINYSNRMINVVCLGILYLVMATNCQEIP